MARMTDEEADALDELWTRTTPEIDTSKSGFLTRKGFTTRQTHEYFVSRFFAVFGVFSMKKWPVKQYF